MDALDNINARLILLMHLSLWLSMASQWKSTSLVAVMERAHVTLKLVWSNASPLRTLKGGRQLFVLRMTFMTMPRNCSPGHLLMCILIPINAINRQREDRLANIKALPGTRSLHSIGEQEPYLISFRERSCFCTPCIQQDGQCENLDFAGTWKEAHLNIKRPVRPTTVPGLPLICLWLLTSRLGSSKSSVNLFNLFI